MFDILFGWRKASKCKKLIRRVQCRLKLLKNKRSTIVRQLRDDVAELLKHGHVQSAFDRVEQLFKDESLVAVYDLLDHFCEFILINLPYIRRNKDCPNDINEAASTLIFASARFGDLPELRMIRKLFGERYGQRFANVAVELLPGNLVNPQMQKKISIKSVPDDVKSSLIVEIARSSLQSGPLLLEYSSELQQQLANKCNADKVDPILSIKTTNFRKESQNPQAPNISEAEGEIVYVDFSSEKKNCLKDLNPSFWSSKALLPSTCISRVQQSYLNTVESSMHKKSGLLVSSVQKIYPCEFSVSGLEQVEESVVEKPSALTYKEGSEVVESASESSAGLPEEMVYLEDIEELESPVRKEGSFQDQRLFMFKPSVHPMRKKIDNQNDQGLEDYHDSHHVKSASRSFRKSKKASGKRLRRRSVSIDIMNTKDVECAIYYGESCDSSPNYEQKSHDRRKHHKKISTKLHQKSYTTEESPIFPSFIEVRSSFSLAKCRDEHMRSSSRCGSNNTVSDHCSLEHPCYFCTGDEKDDCNSSPKIPKIQCRLCHYQCSCNKMPDILEAGGLLLPQASKNHEDAANSTLLVSSCPRAADTWTSTESKPPYSRAMTMPIERPNDSCIDSFLRSNSFPLPEPRRYSSNRHVHPKLPDYDQLAAKFTALKKENLQIVKQ